MHLAYAVDLFTLSIFMDKKEKRDTQKYRKKLSSRAYPKPRCSEKSPEKKSVGFYFLVFNIAIEYYLNS